jgi:FMN reductase
LSGPVLIVGVGGAARVGSTTEQALVAALETAEKFGAKTRVFGGRFLNRLPLYAPGDAERTSDVTEFIEAIRAADGVIIASPGYHGAMAGMTKNAIDYLEDLRDDSRPYLSGRAVGCIATAGGWQAAVATVIGLRTVVHALRGWPTPLGVAINTAASVNGEPTPLDQVKTHLAIVATEVFEFAEMWRLRRSGHRQAEVVTIRPEDAAGILIDAVPQWG